MAVETLDIEVLVKGIEASIRNLRRLEGTLAELGNSLNTISEAIKVHKKRIDEVEWGFKRWRREAESFVKVLKAEARWLSGFAFIGAFIGGIRDAIYAVSDLNQAVLSVASAVEAGQYQFRQFRNILISVARESVFSFRELGEALTVIARAGVESAEGMRNILSVAVKMAYVAGERLTDTARYLVSVQKLFALTGKDLQVAAGRTANALIWTKAELSDLITAFKYSAPYFAMLPRAGKETYAEWLAVTAVLTDLGLSASTAGTAIRSLITQMIFGAERRPVLRRLYRELGIDMLNLVKSTGSYIQAFGKLFEEMKKHGYDLTILYQALGSRGTQALGFIAKGLERMEKLYRRLIAITTMEDLTERYRLMASTIRGQFAITMNQIRALVAQAEPVIANFLSVINSGLRGIVSAFQALNTAMQQSPLMNVMFIGALMLFTKTLMGARQEIDTLYGEVSKRLSPALGRMKTGFDTLLKYVMVLPNWIKVSWESLVKFMAFTTIDEFFGKLTLNINKLKGGLIDLGGRLRSLVVRFLTLRNILMAFIFVFPSFIDKLSEMSKSIEGIKEAFLGLHTILTMIISALVIRMPAPVWVKTFLLLGNAIGYFADSLRRLRDWLAGTDVLGDFVKRFKTQKEELERLLSAPISFALLETLPQNITFFQDFLQRLQDAYKQYGNQMETSTRETWLRLINTTQNLLAELQNIQENQHKWDLQTRLQHFENLRNLWEQFSNEVRGIWQDLYRAWEIDLDKAEVEIAKRHESLLGYIASLFRSPALRRTISDFVSKTTSAIEKIIDFTAETFVRAYYYLKSFFAGVVGFSGKISATFLRGIEYVLVGLSKIPGVGKKISGDMLETIEGWRKETELWAESFGETAKEAFKVAWTGKPPKEYLEGIKKSSEEVEKVRKDLQKIIGLPPEIETPLFEKSARSLEGLERRSRSFRISWENVIKDLKESKISLQDFVSVLPATVSDISAMVNELERFERRIDRLSDLLTRNRDIVEKALGISFEQAKQVLASYRAEYQKLEQQVIQRIRDYLNEIPISLREFIRLMRLLRREGIRIVDINELGFKALLRGIKENIDTFRELDNAIEFFVRSWSYLATIFPQERMIAFLSAFLDKFVELISMGQIGRGQFERFIEVYGKFYQTKENIDLVSEALNKLVQVGFTNIDAFLRMEGLLRRYGATQEQINGILQQTIRNIFETTESFEDWQRVLETLIRYYPMLRQALGIEAFELLRNAIERLISSARTFEEIDRAREIISQLGEQLGLTQQQIDNLILPAFDRLSQRTDELSQGFDRSIAIIRQFQIELQKAYQQLHPYIRFQEQYSQMLSEAVDLYVKAIESAMLKGQEFAQSPEVQMAFENLKTAVEPFIERIKAGTMTLDDLLKRFDNVYAKMTVMKVAFEELGVSMSDWQKILFIIKDSFRSVFGKDVMDEFMLFYNFMLTVWQQMGLAFKQMVVAVIKRDLEGLKEAFYNFAQAVVNAFLEMIAQIIAMQVMKGIFAVFGLPLPVVGAKKGGILPGAFIPIQEFQYGGVVEKPTLGLIGEEKPEAVVPLEKGRYIPVKIIKEQKPIELKQQIVNVVDPNLIYQALSTPMGQNVVLNIIGANINVVRKMLIRSL